MHGTIEEIKSLYVTDGENLIRKAENAQGLKDEVSKGRLTAYTDLVVYSDKLSIGTAFCTRALLDKTRT